ncbi:MAG TPA: succinylglutamate desuccinylase/aspartoacylase family protein [Ferrovibrio sp.]|uniref:succinylglutamate desuccinylase/aspartoacylase family protein n=1 Tax=Ferrovibrio sp. TaxID=1917215 RepID=UPI002ED4F0DA
MRVRTVTERPLRFAAAALQDHRWSSYEIEGDGPGPRLCIMAGMHVNEVAGIAAARELIAYFRRAAFIGRVAILPIVDPPALAGYVQHVSPVDGKNINFSFPGSASGSFSEALADALLNDWADDADLLIDLHGGDLCETMVPFTIVQQTGDAGFDAGNLALARAFAPPVIVRLSPAALARPGRSCTARAARRQRAVFAEAGANGLLDAASTAFHVAGVQRAAAELGMLAGGAEVAGTAPALAGSYHFIAAAVDGWCEYAVTPGERIAAGQLLGRIEDLGGGVGHDLQAPAAGILLWRCTHPLVTAGQALFGLAGEIEDA